MALKYDARSFDGLPMSIGHMPDFASNLSDKLNAVSGTTTIAIGAATVNVDVDPALHGKALIATLNGVAATGAEDVTATSITSARWSGSVTGRFSINVNANATAVIKVSYYVAGA